MPTEAEWLTRKSRIDTRLKQKGWKLVRFSPELSLNELDKIAVEELPTANGPADYALFVRGQLLGIVEAKKVSVNPQNVLEQAKRYARDVFAAAGEWNGFRVPFLYASNGTLIWHLDARPQKLVSRQLSGFHTPEALAGFFASDTSGARSCYLRASRDLHGTRRPSSLNPRQSFQRRIVTTLDQSRESSYEHSTTTQDGGYGFDKIPEG